MLYKKTSQEKTPQSEELETKHTALLYNMLRHNKRSLL